MTAHILLLAEGLALPAFDAATQRYTWIGTSGAGKSYSCGRFVEQAHDCNIPQLIVDTVGIWAAIRLAADGKSPGLPFAVIGGEHADVPLDLDRAEELARFVGAARSSFVLDLSDLAVKDRARFAARFFDGLLRAIRKNPTPRMVHIDEAQDLAPERARHAQADMVTAVSAFVRKARNHLCGVSLLTQRPQSVSKEVLNLCNNLFLGILQGKRDRTAVNEWIESNAVPDDWDMLKELPSLQPGDFFFCSPSWLRRFARVHILPKRTFDGSSTTRIDASVELARLAPVDVGALRALLQPADDVADAGPVGVDGEPLTNAENAELRRQLEDHQDAIAELRAERDGWRRRFEVVLEHITTQRQLAAQAEASFTPWLTEPLPQPDPRMIDPALAARARSITRRLHATLEAENPLLKPNGHAKPAPTGELTAYTQELLDALCARPMDRKMLSVYTGRSRFSSTWSQALTALKDEALITEDAGVLSPTAKGKAAGTPKALSRREHHARWIAQLRSDFGDYTLQQFEAIWQAPREGITRQSIGQATGHSTASSTFSTSITDLVRVGLVEKAGNRLRISATFAALAGTGGAA